jgi:hypothetical protein
MKTQLSLLALGSLLASPLCTAQTNEPAVEDFKPSSLNQPGKQYPQVNSERRVRTRVVAPQAQSVTFEFLGGGKYPLTKGDDGAWVGVTRPQDEGFHYYLSPDTAHEWQSWRRGLHELAPLLFAD